MSLYESFSTDLAPQLKTKMGCKNIHQVPRIQKIIVNMGIGSVVTRNGVKDFMEFETNLAKITGQKPHIIKSKKAVSNFKLRAGLAVMMKCTLRGRRAYDFLERLIYLVLPRVRDFKGASAQKFDANANLNIGFKQYDVFPEIGPDDMKIPMGLQVTIITTTNKAKDAQILLETLGMPFEKK